MTTDNRTNEPTAEQIVAEAMVNAGAPLMHSRVEEAVCAALRARGLLSEGAPSEALIAEAKRRARKRRGAGWLEEADMLDRLIAALVAAQGAAPVAATRPVIDPPLHPDEREPIALNPLLRGVDLALDRLIRRDCFSERTLRVIDELRDELTHPVLPSSGVDEETLANLIHSTSVAHFGGLDPRVAPIIARAVAEWLHSNPTKSA